MTLFTGKQALIIEDDATSILVLKKMLQQLDITVTIIHGSIGVKQQLQQAAVPDMIFLDLEMPGSNGYTVLGIIRDIPTIKHVSVIAYTTHTSHLNTVRRAGFDGFLGKPLDSSQFPEQIRRILEGEHIWEVPG